MVSRHLFSLVCDFSSVLCGHWRVKGDQLWELPLSLERDKMNFLPVVSEGQHGIRGNMPSVIELPLMMLEGETGSFRGGRVLITFQKWFP